MADTMARRMPRLGEHLVAAGLLTAEQVEQALRAQVMWGGRLGTNLIELHYLDLDPLAIALGRQHRMPAALARHFEKADPALQRLLSPDFAERFACIPLLEIGAERDIVVACLSPLQPRQLAIIADELSVDGRRLVPAIAAELRIRYQLERVYNVRRAARFLRARGKSIPAFPAFDVAPAVVDRDPHALPTSTHELATFRRPVDPAEATAPPDPELALDLEPQPAAPDDAPTDELEIGGSAAIAATQRIEPVDDYDLPTDAQAPLFVEDLSQHATLDDELEHEPRPIEDERAARERRTYVRTLADAAESDRQALARIAIRKVAVGSAPRVMAGATLGEATRAIRRGTGRDRVADLVIDTLDRFTPACEAAIMLVVRGATAIGWKGFQRQGAGLGEIAVPLENGGLISRAVEHNVTLQQPAAELDAIDRLLLELLGQPAGDLVVVPISIASQVMCVIAIAAAAGAQLTSAEQIAAAAGAAFARLIRDASR
jgi:hypothetical protein